MLDQRVAPEQSEGQKRGRRIQKHSVIKAGMTSDTAQRNEAENAKTSHTECSYKCSGGLRIPCLARAARDGCKFRYDLADERGRLLTNETRNEVPSNYPLT